MTYGRYVAILSVPALIGIVAILLSGWALLCIPTMIAILIVQCFLPFPKV